MLPGLPLSALAFFAPAAAATILRYRANGKAGVSALLKRAIDWKRIPEKIWFAPIILVMPSVMVLAYAWMRWIGQPVPAPQLSVLGTLAMFCAFLIAALGEELGWSGYAIDPLQHRWNALQAAIFLGIIWSVWHYIPLIQARRSTAWIAWWFLYSVASRVLIVWIYNNTGKSVFAATLYHALMNLSWQLFPIHGSYWDPRIIAPIVTLAALIVTIVWGPRTLARNQ